MKMFTNINVLHNRKKFTKKKLVIIETLTKAIKSNDVTKVEDWFATNRVALKDQSLYYLVKFVRDVEIFLTLYHMCGEEIMDCYKKHKKSMLNHAIIEGKDIKIIEEILKIDKNAINSIDKSGKSPLMYAVLANKDVSVIKFLLENNAYVNICNAYGKTPLHFAQKSEVVKLLIGNGAWLNVADKGGCTPIMNAIKCKRDKKIILELIKNGADLEVSNHLGQTCLHLALNFKYDEDVINRICCKTRNYNLEDYQSLTPLSYALDDLNIGPPYQIDFILKLIKKGFIVNANGIMHAVKHCRNVDLIIDIIESLEKCVGIRCVDNYGNSVLHFASDVRLIKVLARRGAPLNHENEGGKTPLAKAIFQRKSIEIIETLLFWGSDVKNLVDFFNKNFIISDSVYDLLILYGMSVSLKNNFIKSFFHDVIQLISSFRYLAAIENYGLLRHIFISNENVALPEGFQTSMKIVKDLFKCYQNELNKMKDEIFSNNISYYNFCTKLYRSIASQYVHEGFSEADYENLKNQFPTFHNEIAIKIKINIKINKRKNLLKKLIQVNLAIQIERNNHFNNDNDVGHEYIGLDCDSMYTVGSYINARDISCLLAAAIA